MIFFFSYIIIMTVTIIAVVNYRVLRTKIKKPIEVRTTKFWIIVGVLTLQFVRII